jgi:hypothetical protein
VAGGGGPGGEWKSTNRPWRYEALLREGVGQLVAVRGCQRRRFLEAVVGRRGGGLAWAGEEDRPGPPSAIAIHIAKLLAATRQRGGGGPSWVPAAVLLVAGGGPEGTGASCFLPASRSCSADGEVKVGEIRKKKEERVGVSGCRGPSLQCFVG